MELISVEQMQSEVEMILKVHATFIEAFTKEFDWLDDRLDCEFMEVFDADIEDVIIKSLGSHTTTAQQFVVCEAFLYAFLGTWLCEGKETADGFVTCLELKVWLH